MIYKMKRITWTIGVQKPQGNIIQDAMLHYNEPAIILLNGIPLDPTTNYTYSPDCLSGTYSDTLGYLDFTPMGGLLNTQSLQLVW